MDDEQEKKPRAKRSQASGNARKTGSRSRSIGSRTADSRSTRKRAARLPDPRTRIRPAADPRRSRSLEYGAAIVACFSAECPALGIAELAELIGISRSTTHRYATTLVELGYLEQDRRRKYRLASRAADVGRAAIAAVRIDVGGRAVLEELRDELGCTVSMGILSGVDVLYVYRLFGHRRGQYAIDRCLQAGARAPLHCTALGKILLAALSAAERERLIEQIELTPAGPNAIRDRRELSAAIERIGASSAALSDEEQLAGARSVAVLVPGSRGGHTIALEATATASAYGARRLLSVAAPALKRAAKLIDAH